MYLGANNFDEEAFKHVILGMRNMPQLGYVVLNHNYISFSNLGHLFTTLRTIVGLASIGLVNTTLTDTGCIYVINGLLKKTKFFSLDLQDNVLSDKCIMHISKNLENITSLSKLYLANNNFTNIGKSALINAWNRTGRPGNGLWFEKTKGTDGNGTWFFTTVRV